VRDVLWFERQVVERLVTTPDTRRRGDIESFVEGALQAMPEHLRASIAAASVVLGGWARVARPDKARLVQSLDTSPIAPIRQYVRVFRSLVLFAESEIA
jgi:hypothetical protein